MACTFCLMTRAGLPAATACAGTSLQDYRIGADNGTVSNLYRAQDRCARADKNVVADNWYFVEAAATADRHVMCRSHSYLR